MSSFQVQSTHHKVANPFSLTFFIERISQKLFEQAKFSPSLWLLRRFFRFPLYFLAASWKLICMRKFTRQLRRCSSDLKLYANYATMAIEGKTTDLIFPTQPLCTFFLESFHYSALWALAGGSLENPFISCQRLRAGKHNRFNFAWTSLIKFSIAKRCQQCWQSKRNCNLICSERQGHVRKRNY